MAGTVTEGDQLIDDCLDPEALGERGGLAMVSATPTGSRAATGTRHEAGDTRVGSIELAIPGCGPARTFPASWSHAGAASRQITSDPTGQTVIAVPVTHRSSLLTRGVNREPTNPGHRR